MALALLANALPPIIQILNANRGSYATTVATNHEGVGAYPFQQEVLNAALHADGLVITEGYFQSKKEGLRNRFLTNSANIADSALLPEFDGLMGKCEWATDGVAWQPSIEAQSKDDVTQSKQLGSYVGTTAFRGSHFLQDGYVFHNSPFFRLAYPAYTKTTVLQALEQHEPLIIAWALELLYKTAANAPFEYYAARRQELLQRVIEGKMQMMAVRPMPKEMRG